MDFNFYMTDNVSAARHDMVHAGFTELTTPEEADKAMKRPGTTLVLINSVCGCAGSIARPAATSAIHYDARPNHLVTVFAGQDKEATAQVRSYFPEEQPTSPSFALLKDGKLQAIIHRDGIEGQIAITIISKLQRLFDEFCEEI